MSSDFSTTSVSPVVLLILISWLPTTLKSKLGSSACWPARYVCNPAAKEGADPDNACPAISSPPPTPPWSDLPARSLPPKSNRLD